MAKAYTFKALLTNAGWLENATVFLDDQGRLTAIETHADAPHAEPVNGYALPGFQNAHSHAFQYAMAGLAERHEGTGIPDDFWSWRTAMYNLALQISPEQLEAIATMLYAEMLRHGYTAVAEFHYLHHDLNGQPYNNRAELGERLVAAAKNAGIKITLVPMFYQQGGFGKPAEGQQRRFISPTVDAYYQLLDSSQQAVSHYPHAKLGQGIHSLRAVSETDIKTVCRDFQNDRPFHIHVSEQLKEIDDCLAFYGQRPVEWLLNNAPVNAHYHLVHATHLSTPEVQGIAQAQANVVLCPSTEGNLGDGLFRFADFKAQHGNWSIGTDSHVGLNPLEELRLLDYGQRLTTHKRHTFFQQGQGDSGFNAIEMAWKTGRKAMGETHTSFFTIGEPFDSFILNIDSPLLNTASPKHRCNTLVYASDVSNSLGTIVNGQWVVKHNQHHDREKITKEFIKALRALGVR